jgi:hypothetical protein
MRARIPGLEERGGRGEEEVRESDGGGEEREDAKRGLGDRGSLPLRIGEDRQRRRAEGEDRDVDDGLPSRGQLAIEKVRVEVAEEQHDLEEQHARAPDGRSAAEPRQDHLGNDGLDLEQEERGKEDRCCVEQHGKTRITLLATDGHE